MKLCELFLILVFIFLVSSVRAAFTSSPEMLLPVVSAGAGGIGVANINLGDSMFQNPAGLVLARRGRLAASAGNLGGRQAGIAGFSAIMPLDSSLGLGLSWNTFRDWEFGTYAEQTLGGALAVSFGSYFSAGAKINYYYLNSENIGNTITGTGVDLGFYSNLGDLFDLPGDIVFGGTLVNGVSNWPTFQIRKTVPVISTLGLAWVEGRWEVGLERQWVHAPQLKNQGYGAWRVGGEVSLPWALAVRAGFISAPTSRITLGLGHEFKKTGIILDYALITALRPLVFSHRLGLSVGFGSRHGIKEKRKGPLVLPMQLIMEPGSRRIRMARLALAVNADENVESWSLEIRNKKGKLIRVLRGTGQPPADLVWDGLDEQGNAVDADDVYYQLSIKTPNGIRKGQMLALAAAGAFDASKLYREPEAGPQLIPMLSGIDGSGLKRLTIDFSVLSMTDVAKWQVAIKDEKGKVVKTYRGIGDLPKNLVWDGRLADNGRVKNPLSLRVEFSYTNYKGEKIVISKAVFTQESYENALRELRGRPSFRLIGFRSDFEAGQDGSGARLRVWIPRGRVFVTVNRSPEGEVKRRRAIPRAFYDLDPADSKKAVPPLPEE